MDWIRRNRVTTEVRLLLLLLLKDNPALGEVGAG